MKKISAANTESIVFIVEDDTTRRMLKMYLAAVGLDARVYSSSEEYRAYHDSARTQYLVLDMPLPGMDGAILRRRQTRNTKFTSESTCCFELIPIKNRNPRQTCRLRQIIQDDGLPDCLSSRFFNGGEPE